MDRGNRFPKGARLRRRREYLHVQQVGRRFHGTFLILIRDSRAGAAMRTRLGITVSKRVGNAVVRNRVKRLIREAFRQIEHLQVASDLVVIAKREANGAPFATIRGELSHLLSRPVVA